MHVPLTVSVCPLFCFNANICFLSKPKLKGFILLMWLFNECVDVQKISLAIQYIKYSPQKAVLKDSYTLK